MAQGLPSPVTQDFPPSLDLETLTQMVYTSSAIGKKIVTVEGLSADPDGRKAQQAWIDHQVPQCGYCQPGMLMACVGAMKAGHHGTEIGSEMKHLCACGTYQRIRTAIKTL